jgi:hypothetical protein
MAILIRQFIIFRHSHWPSKDQGSFADGCQQILHALASFGCKPSLSGKIWKNWKMAMGNDRIQ